MEQKGMGSRLFGSRTRLIIMTLGAGFAILIIRLFYLQVVQADMWKEKASSQQMYSTSISANRGNIYDRNMKTLAKSVTVWTVFISPAEMEEDQRELVASGLSEILDVDYDMVYEKSLKTWRYNETIKKKADNDTADEVTAFIKENDIKGIYLSEDTMRYYPYGNLASTVLGFTGNDGTGAYGLEAYYNKTLSGTNGVIASVRNAKGTAMPFSEQQIYDAEDGQSLVLTIDETVQHYLEKHLENAVQEHEVQNRAVGIVMNVKTGEILGMYTKPDFEPNNPSDIYDKNTKTMISINNLQKKFGEKLAVNIDHYEINQGDMLGLVGNNGAGKTTLFRLMLDLLKADNGNVVINEIDVSQSEDWKNFTGAFIDDGFLIDYLTPEEYFYFIGKMYGLKKEEVDERLLPVERLMSGEVIGQKKLIRNYSAGNKQKIGIISAMLHYPQLLILDEPFNFLDPSSQSIIKHMLKKYSEEHNATVIISSHNLNHTIDVCPRIALLENGVIIRDIMNENNSAEKELEDYFNVEE